MNVNGAVIHDTTESKAKKYYEYLYGSKSPHPFINVDELIKGQRYYKPCYLCDVDENTRENIEALYPVNT